MSQAASPSFALKATIVHSRDVDTLEIYNPGLLVVDTTGKICQVVDMTSMKVEEQQELISNVCCEVQDLGKKFVIPGFVDTHAHAPQYSFTGTGLDLPLLQWLEKYTFPTEAKFDDAGFARRVYESTVRKHLTHGTTTCSYFGTIHLEASKILADIVEQVGQRGIVGKVNMDRNSMDYYIENTETSLLETEEFIQYCLSKNNPCVIPCITPRFVPSCTRNLMEGLGKLASKYDLPIQSHLSENMDECTWVQELHPECSSYADVYDSCGLLTPKTYMAHCVFCPPEERTLLFDKQVGISHCPNSNLSLQSGHFNARMFMREGHKIGLGTDVAGGYSPSILDAIRHTIAVSKVLCMHRRQSETSDPESDDEESRRMSEDLECSQDPLTIPEAFFLATLGGAQVLGLGETIGNFVVGKDFDAVIVDPTCEDSPFDVFDEIDTTEEVFQKFLFLGDDRNCRTIFVAGQQVFSRA